MNELSGARAVFLVARREFQTRVRGRVFVIGTAVAIAGLAAYSLIQVLVLDRISTTQTFNVGFTAEARPLARPLQAAAPALDIRVHVSEVAGEDEGLSQVRSGKLDALVTGAPDSPRVVVEGRLDSGLRSALNGLVRQEAFAAQLRSAGLDPAAVQAHVNAAAIQLQVLRPPAPTTYQQPVVGVVTALILYIFLGIYGGIIGQGVVAEKASRVVEILLSTVQPGQLLLGKVAGIGLVGLLQLLIIGAAGLVFTLPTQVVTIPAATVGTVAGGVVWFVLGFLLYALMMSAAAALVSRLEEVQAATMPVTMLLVLAWIMAASVELPQTFARAAGSSVSDNLVTAGVVLSFFPPFTPVLMPIRVASGDVPAWQVLLALALMLASIAAAAWVAARVYANSILRFGARTRLLEALRGARSVGR